MKQLKYAVIVLSMVLSMVFISEAISTDSNNPLSVKAQSTATKKYRRPYHGGYGGGGYCYKIKRIKKCWYVKVRRCRWVTIKVRIPCPPYGGYRRYRRNY
jgi:hypothetical protein